MIRPLVVFIALFALVSTGTLMSATAVGCKKADRTTAQRLVGMWILDIDATLEGLPEESRAIREPHLRASQFGMEFGEQGVLFVRMGRPGEVTQRAGRYTLTSDAPGDIRLQLTLTADPETGASEQEAHVTITFRSDGRMVFAEESDLRRDAASRYVLQRVNRRAYDKATKATEPTENSGGAFP